MPTVALRCPPPAARCPPSTTNLQHQQGLATPSLLQSSSSSSSPQQAAATGSSTITITSNTEILRSSRNNSSSTHHPNYHPCPRLRRLDVLLMIILVVVTAVASTALVIDWNNKSLTQLRLWLMVYLFLLVIRLCGRPAMGIFPRDRWLITGRLFTICLWFFSLLSFIWFIIGVVWITQIQYRQRSLLWYVVVVLVGLELCIAASWILLALIVFLFALQPVLTSRNRTPAATTEDLEKLPTYKYQPDTNINNTDSTPVCSICLCEYQPDEILRELPCAVGAHTFHASCVDEWLLQKLSCPICRDDPLHKNDQTDIHRSNDSQTIITTV